MPVLDKSEAAREVLTAALPHLPFEGWHMGLLRQAAKEAGYETADIARIFPAGVEDAVKSYLREADRVMLQRAEQYHFETMRGRDRIAACIRIRLEYFLPHREAVRRTIAWQSLHPLIAAASLARTVDAMWQAAGDRSSDFSWYTKRGTLAAIYVSTLTVWLNDQSPGQQETMMFLERRLDGIMQFGKRRRAAEEAVSQFIRGFKEGKR